MVIPEAAPPFIKDKLCEEGASVEVFGKVKDTHALSHMCAVWRVFQCMPEVIIMCTVDMSERQWYGYCRANTVTENLFM